MAHVQSQLFIDALLHPETKQIMSCSGAYVKELEGKQLTLEDLAEYLRKSKVELVKASDDVKLANNLLAVARAIAIASDMIIFYYTKIPAIQVTKDIAITHAFWDLGKEGAKTFSDVITNSKRFAKLKTNNYYEKDLIKDVAKESAKLADTVLKNLKKSKLGKAGGLLSPVIGIFIICYDIYTAVIDCLENKNGMDDLIGGTITQLDKLDRQIAVVKSDLNKCGLIDTHLKNYTPLKSDPVFNLGLP